MAVNTVVSSARRIALTMGAWVGLNAGKGAFHRLNLSAAPENRIKNAPPPLRRRETRQVGAASCQEVGVSTPAKQIEQKVR